METVLKNTTNIALMFDITQTLLVWVTVCLSFRRSHIINWEHHDNGNQAPVDISHLFTPKKKMWRGGLTANVRSSWLKCMPRLGSFFLSFFFLSVGSSSSYISSDSIRLT